MHLVALTLAFVASLATCSSQPFAWQSQNTRSNFCEYEDRFRNATRQGLRPLLSEALSGAELSVLYDERPFETNLDSSGNIEGGFFVELVRETARRGGFTLIEDVSPGKPEEFETWTDYMNWAVDNYDMFAEWYAEDGINLAENNVVFPLTFLDLSFVLVIPQPKDSSNFWKTAFSFLQPFNFSLWLACIAGAIFSGIIFMLLERNHNEDDFDPALSSFVQVCTHSIWVSFCMFTGAAGYTPRTAPGKVFVFFWSFLSLLVVSAYTANLAMFMVVKNSPKPQIKSLRDASEMSATLCIFDTAVAGIDRIKRQFPTYQADGMLALFPWGSDMLGPMKDGQCQAAILNKFEWDSFRADIEFNPECDVMFPGRSFWPVKGGFPVRRDNSDRCTSFVREVLSSILPTMVNDNFVTDLETDFWSKKATVTCGSDDDVGEEEGMELAVESMVGAFMIHIFVSACVLVWARLARPPGYESPDQDEGAGKEKAVVEHASPDDAKHIGKHNGHHAGGTSVEELRAEMERRNLEIMQRFDAMTLDEERRLDTILRAVQAGGVTAGRRPSERKSFAVSLEDPNDQHQGPKLPEPVAKDPNPPIDIPSQDTGPEIFPPVVSSSSTANAKHYLNGNLKVEMHGDLVGAGSPPKTRGGEWGAFHWPWEGTGNGSSTNGGRL